MVGRERREEEEEAEEVDAGAWMSVEEEQKHADEGTGADIGGGR